MCTWVPPRVRHVAIVGFDADFIAPGRVDDARFDALVAAVGRICDA